MHPEYDEWICSNHWRGVPKATKKRHLDFKRMVRRDPAIHLLARVEIGRAWVACVEAANQSAAGIG